MKDVIDVGDTVLYQGDAYTVEEILYYLAGQRLVLQGLDYQPLTTYCQLKVKHTPAIPAIPVISEEAQGKGMKFDGDKLRMDLLIMGMPHALEGISEVLTFGARKYAADSWQAVPDGIRRYEGAAMRHKSARLKGEWLDPESGKPHIYHELCCMLFIAQLHEINKENQTHVQ